MFNMQTTVSDDGEGNVKLNFDKLQVVCLEYQWSDDNEFMKGLLCSYSLYLSLHFPVDKIRPGLCHLNLLIYDAKTEIFILICCK